MKKIAILGSTGSIGTQTLDVVRANGDIQVKAHCGWQQYRSSGETDRGNLSRLSAAVWDEEKGKGPESPACRGYWISKIVSGMDGLIGDRGHGRIWRSW